uniref:thiol-disulfide oxidoreductase DCC family protein n=1 Tax=uncultured Allobacillus sp. TaxID=1638025 RepID=UPI00259A753B|nr:thiol-disulfide oxidoreductase DCC family protein [uncultured Allobacillus sp.]
MDKSIILFDGVCNLCNGAAQFLITRDSKDQFRFASLQSDLGRKVMNQLKTNDVSSMILIESGRIYTKSTAALRIARHLPSPWKYFHQLINLPKTLRDPVYNYIARNRYQWFGIQDTCMVPTPDNRRKFLMNEM